jgi:hypothetical protein
MGSKFFGNRMDKQAPNKKGVKQNFKNKSNNAKSGGVRKTGKRKLIYYHIIFIINFKRYENTKTIYFIT